MREKKNAKKYKIFIFETKSTITIIKNFYWIKIKFFKNHENDKLNLLNSFLLSF